MKKLIILTFLGIFAFSCTNDDWKGELEDMQTELDEVKEELANQKKLIEALQKNATISGIEQGNGCYTIKFSDGQSIMLTNGKTPLINIGENGNWFIDGQDTGKSSKGADGQDGTNGHDGETPNLEIGTNGNWYINGEDTGMPSKGKDGINGSDSPVITSIVDTQSAIIFNFSDGSKITMPKYLKWNGKKVLVIGDSVTAALKWQNQISNVLGATVRTHAKGGIGIIQMVDGDGSGKAPEGYDPDNFGVAKLYALNTDDVNNVDVIILMGFYNEREWATNNPGDVTDMYPMQQSFMSMLNYAIKRVYEELVKANNLSCQVVICSAHKYGKYSWIDKTAYEDGDDLFNATKEVAEYNSLPLIDLMNYGGINKFNWNLYQASPSPLASNYLTPDGINDGTNKPFNSLEVAPNPKENKDKYITIKGQERKSYKSDGIQWKQDRVPYPWNADQLHLNNQGYEKIGKFIATYLLNHITFK